MAFWVEGKKVMAQAPVDETVVFQHFCQAAAQMLQAGFEFAKRDSPELYRECLQVLEGGHAKVELRVEFQPKLAVSVRLVHGEETVEIFRYESRPSFGSRIWPS
jgi:hypothetical protein